MTSDDNRFEVDEPEPKPPGDTIPPPPDDPKEEKMSSTEFKNIIEKVGEKLSSIDMKLVNVQGELQVVKADVEEVKADVEELHALLVGIPHPNVVALKIDRETKKIGGIGQVFHAWNQHLAIIEGNTQIMMDRHEQYANEVSRVHQENVKIKLEIERIKALIALRLTELPPESATEST